MWIVKNETAEALPLPEFQVEIPCKDYLDLDAHGRDRVEKAESVRAALQRGLLRTIRKTEPAPAVPAQAEEMVPSAPAVLRDLADRPPILSASAASPGEEPPEGPLGIREIFRRTAPRRARREGEPEEPASSPAAAEVRRELERFRVRLLADLRRMLDERPAPPTKK